MVYLERVLAAQEWEVKVGESFGLGGAGGLLGKMMGGSAANDNAPKEALRQSRG